MAIKVAANFEHFPSSGKARRQGERGLKFVIRLTAYFFGPVALELGSTNLSRARFLTSHSSGPKEGPLFEVIFFRVYGAFFINRAALLIR